jgi:hypothetical protein
MPNTVSTHATSDLGPKLVRAEQALTAIPPGSRVYLGTGCAAPRKLLATLEAMSPGPADLEFVSFVTTSAVPKEEAGVPLMAAIATARSSSAATCAAADSSTTCPFH